MSDYLACQVAVSLAALAEVVAPGSKWVPGIPLFEGALQVVACWVVFFEALPFCFSDMYRPVEEHSDYTYSHLPFRNEPPVRLRKPEAKFASRAARMARSSLPIRSRLK